MQIYLYLVKKLIYIDWVKFGQSIDKYSDGTKDKIWKDTKNDDTIDMYNGTIDTKSSLVPLLMNNGIVYDKVWAPHDRSQPIPEYTKGYWKLTTHHVQIGLLKIN